MLDEVERVLHYPRLVKRFGLSEQAIAEYVAFLANSAEIVELDTTIWPPIRDPKDVHIIQTAINGKAEYLCTLDKHFFEPQVVEFCSNYALSIISDLDLLRLIRVAS
jgi:putative PIN family toxin of toxin-antitoxin system